VHLLTLGSGGWIPTAERETCSYAIREDGHVLVLDAGSGLRRLLDAGDVLRGAESVDIVLTHFHLDHVVGLGYLPAIASPEAITIWGPGEWLYGAPTASLLTRILEPPFFSAGLPGAASRVRELTEGVVACDGFELRTRAQLRHSSPTVGLRVGDAVAYCTDTAFDAGNVELAAGARLLLHEAWHPTDDTDDVIHSSAGQAARIARDAGVGELALIHLDPLLRSAEALEATARSVFPSSRAARDLESFELG
jgi:ribonuclease BN (tRNA processing enzyme)